MSWQNTVTAWQSRGWTLPWPRRQLVVPLVVTLLVALGLLAHQQGATENVLGATGSWLPHNRPKLIGRTAVLEPFVHDEVVGAVGRSLQLTGVNVTYFCNFRYGFPEVLSEISETKPVLVDPHTDKINIALQNDEYDNVVLTSCMASLPRLKDALLASKAHVVCIMHHGGRMEDIKPHLVELGKAKRVTVMVLSPHVEHLTRLMIHHWADQGDSQMFYQMPLVTFVPAFVYPQNKTFESPEVFPSKAVIQGNLESFRRNYGKIFSSLQKSMHGNAALWGYEYDLQNKTFMPLEDVKPFTLHLIGAENKNFPLEIPDELKNVVIIHAQVPYPEFYHIVADADLIVPAFNNRGTLLDTASSTVAAALIARTPLLFTEAYNEAYTYIRGPAAILREGWENEVKAMERMRRDGFRRPSAEHLKAEWRQLEDEVQAENAKMWHSIMQ